MKQAKRSRNEQLESWQAVIFVLALVITIVSLPTFPPFRAFVLALVFTKHSTSPRLRLDNCNFYFLCCACVLGSKPTKGKNKRQIWSSTRTRKGGWCGDFGRYLQPPRRRRNQDHYFLLRPCPSAPGCEVAFLQVASGPPLCPKIRRQPPSLGSGALRTRGEAGRGRRSARESGVRTLVFLLGGGLIYRELSVVSVPVCSAGAEDWGRFWRNAVGGSLIEDR